MSTTGLVDLALANRLLARRLAAVADPRPALREIADVIRDEFAIQYRSGRGWPAPEAGYARRKAAAGRGSRVGVYQGLLEASLTQTGVRFAKQKVTPDSVEVRSTDPVANVLRNRQRNPIDTGRIDRAAVTRRSSAIMLRAIAEDAFRSGRS